MEKPEDLSEEDFDNIYDSYKTKFMNERNSWGKKIKQLSDRIKDIQHIPELQVDLYNSRQEAIENYYNYQLSVVKMEKKYNKDRRKYTKEYTEKDIKYNLKELNNIIDGYVAETKAIIDMVKSQSSFFYETAKTIDSIIYGIKHRIEVENFRTTV